MKKSIASGAYVSSQSRGGLLVGLNFFALYIWHQCAESKGIFNIKKECAWAKCLPHKMTLTLGTLLVNSQTCFIFIIQMISQTVFSFKVSTKSKIISDILEETKNNGNTMILLVGVIGFSLSPASLRKLSFISVSYILMEKLWTYTFPEKKGAGKENL